MLNLQTTTKEAENLFHQVDTNNSGLIDSNELFALLTSFPPPVEKPTPLFLRLLSKPLDFLNTTTIQILVYLGFVTIFQVLTESLRYKGEYFFDKLLSDTFINNHFDSSHNTFESIRRIADIYEWGNQVLWPGIFASSGPHCGDVGASFGFDSSLDWSPHTIAQALSAKGCNDDAWPDGEGIFHGRHPTSWSVPELVEWMNELDWSEGISFRQTRVRSEEEGCPVDRYGSECYPDLSKDPAAGTADQTAFGYNWTHPDAPLQNPFTWLHNDEIGADPQGQVSGSPASFRVMEVGGYVALVIPFFAESYVPEYRGASALAPSLDAVRVTRLSKKTPRFFCVRISWNGLHLHQLCDPNDGAGRTTGVVRAAIEEFWNDLKRAHFLDFRTRSLTITMPLRSNNVGVRSRVTLLFEATAVGSLLTSFDMENRVEQKSKRETTEVYAWYAFYFVLFFCIFEGIELVKLGPGLYFNDKWNVMDWFNFGIFFMFFKALLEVFEQEVSADDYCAQHRLCYEIGFFDDWRVMATIGRAKLYLSICVCTQLLKIIKFANVLVPKMGLATNVLAQALTDIIFFGIVFAISMFAFSCMFYVQLGPVMEEYSDQLSSFISLARALFGDFDIDEIMSNTRGYTNALLFLTYLFVAVFIMLSMFFAILGESQQKLRDGEAEARRDAVEKGQEPPSEFGIVTKTNTLVMNGLKKLLSLHPFTERFAIYLEPKSLREIRTQLWTEVQHKMDHDDPKNGGPRISVGDKLERLEFHLFPAVADLRDKVRQLTVRMDTQVVAGHLGSLDPEVLTNAIAQLDAVGGVTQYRQKRLENHRSSHAMAERNAMTSSDEINLRARARAGLDHAEGGALLRNRSQTWAPCKPNGSRSNGLSGTWPPSQVQCKPNGSGSTGLSGEGAPTLVEERSGRTPLRVRRRANMTSKSGYSRQAPSLVRQSSADQSSPDKSRPDQSDPPEADDPNVVCC